MDLVPIGRNDSPHVRARTERTVLLADPRGFCAGVERALAVVEQALRRFGAPVYVRREIVHNRHVVDDLRMRGGVRTRRR
jgi:4-hydroxy-3-methylbut-2-enyl diphosphate reductase